MTYLQKIKQFIKAIAILFLLVAIACDKIEDSNTLNNQDIKIYSGNSEYFPELSSEDSELSVTIFPNPFTNICGIRIRGFNEHTVNIWISDETGILKKRDYYLDNDEIFLMIDFSHDTNDGIYLCDIIIGDTIWRYDLIKQAN